MDGPQLLERGRQSYDAHDWVAAYDALRAADDQTVLDAEDLTRLGLAAGLVGDDEASERHLARSFRRACDADDVTSALWAAFWESFVLSNRGENSRAHGWGERARRLVAGTPEDRRSRLDECLVELLDTMLWSRDGRPDLGGHFARIAEHAASLGNPDLEALAVMGEGFSLIGEGDIAAGMRRLDEVMVAVAEREVHPMAAGLVYCVGLEACRSTLDLSRSMEWTAALSRWCEDQPGIVPYRGQCLVHRVQVMQLRGAWGDATEEAQRACSWLMQPPQPAVGAALYEWAELLRLRGELESAERRYSEASRWGHDPQPGLALLRLTQGRADVAVTGLRRTLAEPHESTVLPTVLAAYVESLVAAGDHTAAEQAAAELRTAAVDLDVPMVGALAAHAEGLVSLASGDAATALRHGRRAWALWHALAAPYHAARSRVLVGEACRALGDEDAARMELEAARTVFEQLDARPDLRRAADLTRDAPGAAGPLSPREREVIRLLAAGLTNRLIAAELFLSEKTVARHVSNIFMKLDVTTRTAAAAYAFAHDLA